MIVVSAIIFFDFSCSTIEKMVHKRYVKKGGKVFGPYYYESYRVGNIVKKRYLGREKNKHDKFLGLKARHLVFFFFIILFAVLINFLQFNPTGKAVLQVSSLYSSGENIEGSLNLILKQGELIPSDSLVRVELGQQKKEISLDSLLDIDKSFGNYYSEGTNISGEGEGYGFNETEELKINLAVFNITAEAGTLEIILVYDNVEILKTSKEIYAEKQETNETILETKTANGREANLTNITIRTIQYKARIGQPVKWIKRIEKPAEKNITIELPKETFDVKIKKIAGEKTEEITGRAKISGLVAAELNLEKEQKFISFIRNLFNKIRKITGFFVGEQENVRVEISEPAENIEVEYYTPAPESFEEQISDKIKKITISGPDTIHYKNILAFTEINEIVSVGNKNKIKIKLLEDNSFVEFEAFDNNNNGLIDYIEWNVPYLSQQEYEIIIEISKAEHLDEDRIFVEDVYEQVKAKDDVWKEIPDKHYLRVTFEQNLTNKNDITIYARGNSAEIEVYRENDNNLITKFENVSEENWHKILLTNLGENESYSTFDLKVTNSTSVEFDYVIDPYLDTGELAQNVNDCGELNTTNAIYTLTQDVNSTATCFNITANNITLDCQGYEINYSYSSVGYGVYVLGVNNSLVKNCIIIEGASTAGSHGIYLNTAFNATIINNTISLLSELSLYPVYLSVSKSINITSNTLSGSGSGGGIYVSPSSNNSFILSNNITTAKVGIVFYSSGGQILYNNISTSATNGEGIRFFAGSGNNNITYNNIKTLGTVSDGIRDSVRNNILYNNISATGGGSRGISGTISNNILNNEIKNGAGGISAAVTITNNNTFKNNLISSGDVGFSIDDNNIIDNNTISSTSYGFDSIGANNIISNLTIKSIATGMWIEGSNNSFSDMRINTTGNSAYGMWIEGSNNSFSDMRINTTGASAYGVYFLSSVVSPTYDNLFNRIVIITSGSLSHGIYPDQNTDTGGHNFSVTDSVINTSSSDAYGLKIECTSGCTEGLTNINFTNVTRLDNSAFTTARDEGATGNLYVYWYFNVNVTNSTGNALQNANISLWDRFYSQKFSELTDANGKIAIKTLQEYKQNTTETTYYTLLILNSTLAPYPNYTNSTINLTNNMLLNIIMGAEGADTEYPLFNNFWNSTYNNTQYYPNMQLIFNSTIISTNGTAGIEFNNINYTSTNSTSYFRTLIQDKPAGTYAYYYWAYGNGTSKLYNKTQVYSWTIATNLSYQYNLFINHTADNFTAIVGILNVPVNATSHSTGYISLYNNGVIINNGTSALFNLTNWTTGGYFNITALYEANTNYSSRIFFYFVNITAVDAEYPLFSAFWNSTYNNTQYYPNMQLVFNATIIRTNGTAGISFNYINYTATNATSFFRVLIADKPAGTYSYYWWGYGNGTSKLYNQTSIFSWTIAKNISMIYAYVNNTRAYFNATNATVNTLINGTLITGTGNINLTLNNTPINYGASPLFNYTNWTLIGVYWVNTTYSGNENYTSSNDGLLVNITVPSTTTILTCGNLDEANTAYNMTQNIIPLGPGPCINITAQNISLDCKGYWISNSSLNVTGIYSNQFNTTIKNCNISMNTSAGGYGIYMQGANNSYIYNNTLNLQYDGLYLLNVYNSKINSITANYNGRYGVAVIGDYNTISNVTANFDLNPIYLSATLYSNFTDISIQNCTTSAANPACIHIRAASSNNVFENIYINNSGRYGIFITSVLSSVIAGNNSFKNVKIENTINESVYLNRNALNTSFINATYTNERVDNNNNELIRKWYFEENVSDANGLLENANVYGYNVSNTLEFSALTNAAGRIPRQEAIQYINYSGTTAYYDTHTIDTSKSGYVTNRSFVNFTGNTWLSVLLEAVPSGTACGNGACDGGETCSSCPSDCGSCGDGGCTSSSWICSTWSSCIKRNQTRTCISNCNNKRTEIINCTTICEENWLCNWSLCENNYEYPISCIDMNNCSTNFSYPVIRNCSCIPDWKCEAWEECQADYTIDDLIKGNIKQEGKQFKWCIDKTGCYDNEKFEQECSLAVPIDVKKVRWCDENYVEIYDKQAQKLVSRIKEMNLTYKKLNVGFIVTNFTGYCDYCYDKIKNYDEERIDCGGSCIKCSEILTEAVDLTEILIPCLWISLLILIMLYIIYFYLSSRKFRECRLRKAREKLLKKIEHLERKKRQNYF